MTTMDEPCWINSGQIDEVAFAEAFLEELPMKCSGGRFFTRDGLVEDEEALRNVIYLMISDSCRSGVSMKVTKLMDALRVHAYTPELPLEENVIHVSNGTLLLEQKGHTPGVVFVPHKQFCVNRLPVPYQPDAPRPERWLAFLDDLLEREDILTLQEFMGYCLIPTTRAQKMLLLIGRGGEGKSRVGLVLRELLGKSMNVSSLQKLEMNRFSRADLEWKLVMVDDDMRLGALPEASTIKTLVTQECPMDIEHKGRQSVQRQLYARLIGFGNGKLSALHDRSYGFFRRQIILTTKDRPDDRVDDRDLIGKLRAECPGILLWCLEGLLRLIGNEFRFSESTRTRENLEQAILEGNNISQFLKDTNRLEYGREYEASSVELYNCYSRWCQENLERILSARTFIEHLRQNEGVLGITYTSHLQCGRRGYRGLRIRPEQYWWSE